VLSVAVAANLWVNPAEAPPEHGTAPATSGQQATATVTCVEGMAVTFTVTGSGLVRLDVAGEHAEGEGEASATVRTAGTVKAIATAERGVPVLRYQSEIVDASCEGP
jgi:hypothetical protein